MEEKKTYTLKSAQSEIHRLQKAVEKKKQKISELTDEMKADRKRLKEMETVYDTLYHEDLQRQIAAEWFKEQRLTGTQITKFLELSRHLHDRIDVLDVGMIVQAVNVAYQAQLARGVPEKDVPMRIFTEEDVPETDTSDDIGTTSWQTGGGAG